jgi:hypothetical protein
VNKRKSVWLMLVAAIACIGCCAVPLYLIIVGASSASLMTIVGGTKGLELLLCLLPVVFIGATYVVTRHKKQCCPEPTDKCGNNQCSTSNLKNTE